jgi:hypothetical protein
MELTDTLGKIFEHLSSYERSKLVTVCKQWATVSISFTLSYANDNISTIAAANQYHVLARRKPTYFDLCGVKDIALQHGCAEIYRVWLRQLPSYVSFDFVYTCKLIGRYGYISMLDVLIEKHHRDYSFDIDLHYVIMEACANHHISLIEYVLVKQPYLICNSKLYIKESRFHIDVVRSLMNHGYSKSQRCLDDFITSCSAGNIKHVQAVVPYLSEHDIRQGMSHAWDAGHYNIQTYLWRVVDQLTC